MRLGLIDPQQMQIAECKNHFVGATSVWASGAGNQSDAWLQAASRCRGVASRHSDASLKKDAKLHSLGKFWCWNFLALLGPCLGGGELVEVVALFVGVLFWQSVARWAQEQACYGGHVSIWRARALKNALANLSVDLRVKGRNYSALVWNVRSYGDAVRCLRKYLFIRLRFFHNCCVC